MDLNLTREQYEKLLELVYLGNWLINAYRTDDYLEDYSDVVSLIFSQAGKPGWKKRRLEMRWEKNICHHSILKKASMIISVNMTASASGKS